MKVILSVLAATLVATFAADITFTNKTATFTNLEGKVYAQVKLVRADLDGLIWRDGASGGRVCFTNLSLDFLERIGVPTNRVQVAADRAARKAATDAAYRAAFERASQLELKRQSDVQRELSATETVRTREAEAASRRAKLSEDINRLRRQIAVDQNLEQSARDRRVFTSDGYFSVTSGSRGSSVDTAASRLATLRQIQQRLRLERAQLAELESQQR